MTSFWVTLSPCSWLAPLALNQRQQAGERHPHFGLALRSALLSSGSISSSPSASSAFFLAPFLAAGNTHADYIHARKQTRTFHFDRVQQRLQLLMEAEEMQALVERCTQAGGSKARLSKGSQQGDPPSLLTPCSADGSRTTYSILVSKTPGITAGKHKQGRRGMIRE
jgi:hypothetical protein